MLKAKFRQTKDCAECGDSFERKRGRMTDATWEKARFCGRQCYYAWQRRQGPRGSDGVVRICAADDCERTFWAYRSQKYCRDPECAAVRNRELERRHLEQHGSPHDLWAFDQATRDGELRRLIAEQEFDAKFGDQFFAGTKSGLTVKRLSDVVRDDSGGTLWQAHDGSDHLQVVADPSGVPRIAGRRRQRSHVPVRRSTKAAAA